jgi:hypothetical protein
MRLAIVSSVFGLVAGSQNSSVKKVITLLGDLKGKVESEIAQGKTDAADYEDWCIKSLTETKADIKYGSEKVEENEARAEDGAAKAQANAAEAAALALEIGKAQNSQQTASALRKEEHSIFTGKEAELVEADNVRQGVQRFEAIPVLRAGRKGRSSNRGSYRRAWSNHELRGC